MYRGDRGGTAAGAAAGAAGLSPEIQNNSAFVNNQNLSIAVSDFWFYSWLNKRPLSGLLLFIGSCREDAIIAKNSTLLKRSTLAIMGWFILCTILLTLPGTSLPSENWMGDIGLDKWIHIFLFAVMAFLACWAIYTINKNKDRNKRHFIIAGLLCIAYGVAMEFVQKYYVPNRSFDLGDIIADAIGGIIGTVYSIRRYTKK